ncbi:MAG: relaxase/mobilization nuclease domain-containing protein [Acetobacter aceti]
MSSSVQGGSVVCRVSSFAPLSCGVFLHSGVLMARDEDFRVRPGHIRSTGHAARPRTFLAQVLHASRRAGGGSSGSPGKGKGSSPRSGPSTFGQGHSRFGRSRLFDAHRRVTVKARVVRQAGRGARPGSLADHLAYLRRDGVTRDGEKAHLFGPDGQEVEAGNFAARCKDDRHHFRFIISPEDALDMADLDGFTRDLVQQMEADLGTRLDWAAVSHWNTDNPHVHLIVRGVDQAGADLVIARDYISHGLRSRAEDLVSLELGPRAEHEIEMALRQDVTAERWTRLDAELQRHTVRSFYAVIRLGTLDAVSVLFRKKSFGHIMAFHGGFPCATV